MEIFEIANTKYRNTRGSPLFSPRQLSKKFYRIELYSQLKDIILSLLFVRWKLAITGAKLVDTATALPSILFYANQFPAE